MQSILILGSGPSVLEARNWPLAPFDRIVAINNAWRVRPDWDAAIYPWDFPAERQPRLTTPTTGKMLVTEDDFVASQNAYGGFVYAGGTMAFTAAYWVLHHYQPAVIAMMGCDMHYPDGQTHFYGKGGKDPLRDDITLQSLEAKSARLMALAARQGCAMVNLSDGPSRLVFPRTKVAQVREAQAMEYEHGTVDTILAQENALGYYVISGRYWEELDRFDADALRELDATWLATV